MSTPFLSRYSTPLVSMCRASPPPLSDTPLHLSFRVSPNHSLPFQVPHPVLLCLSLAALFPYGYPSLFVLTLPRSLFLRVPHSTCCVPFPPCSLPLQVPLPNCLFVSHLTVFPLRYPTLMPYCVPPLLLSSLTSIPPYLSFCFPPLTLSPDRYPLHLSHCVRVRPFPSPPLFLSSLTGTPPLLTFCFPPRCLLFQEPHPHAFLCSIVLSFLPLPSHPTFLFVFLPALCHCCSDFFHFSLPLSKQLH